MSIKKTSLLLILFLSVLSGFSVPGYSATIPTVAPDKGLVIFYREKKMKGAGIRFEINDSSNRSLGLLSNGVMIVKDLEPGNHTFTVRSLSVDGQDSITLSVEAGKTYYVKGEILWGWPAGRPKFSSVSDSEAQSALSKIK